MKIDFNQPVCDLNGKPFPDGEGPLTLSAVCVAALLQTYQDEQGKITGEEKYQRYDLATRVNGKAADVTVEQIGRLKQLIGKFFGPSVVGPTYDMLEGRVGGIAQPIPLQAVPTAQAAPASPKKPRHKKTEASDAAPPSETSSKYLSS